MATVTASNSAILLPRASFLPKRLSKVQPSSLVHGFPVMVTKGKVRCTLEKKLSASDSSSKASMVASLMAAAAMTATTTGPAMALVDERLSTEGIGLPFGLSNNLLGWILLGVFGLIWALYFLYTSDLEEDEESGLSL